MEISYGTQFEKPNPGMYLATVVDVVDLPNQPSQYGPVNKIRIFWVLADMYTGRLVLDKEGKNPLEAMFQAPAKLSPTAKLTGKVTLILGQAPPLLQNTEQLAQLLIGRSNAIMLVHAPNPKDPNDPYINVEAIAPIQQGMPAPPPIPQGYVRRINRPKFQAGPQGQAVPTFAQPPAFPTAPGYGYPAVPAAPTAPAAAYVPAPAAPQAPAPYPAHYGAPVGHVPAPQAGAPVNFNVGAPAAPQAPPAVDPNAVKPF